LKIHPNDEVLEELLLSVGSRLEAVVRHVGGCAYCRAKLAYLPRPSALEAAAEAAQGGAVDYGPAFERAWQGAAARERSLARERADAPALFVELMERPAGEREALLAKASRFHTWGLLELLAERSLEAAAGDPARGEELGLLALQLSQALDSALYGAVRIEDLRARAWAHVANACRIRSDLQGAEEAFGRALESLEKGTGDVLERAVLLDLEASLRRDQRRFEDAFRLLDRAVAIFQKVGERHRAGRSLVSMSVVHNQAGQPSEGIPLLHQALGLIDPERSRACCSAPITT
jgi:tetratricopeptide (TPR) repeat protein